MSTKPRVPQFRSGNAPGHFLPADYLAAVDSWLEWLLHNGGRQASTVEKYRGHLVRFGEWYAAPPAVPHLAPQGADPLRPDLEDLERFAGPVAHAAGIGARARRPIVSALRGFFAWHSSRAGLPNPAAALTQPRFGVRLPRAMPLQQAERLMMAPDLEKMTGLRDAAMFSLLLGAGLRVSGLCALNESDLFWSVDDHGADRLTVRTVEKGARERLVPVANEAAMLLRAYLGHPDLAAIPRQLPNGDAVLFVTVNNMVIQPCDYHGEARRMTRRAVWFLLAGYGKRAGLDPRYTHPHALRHLWGAEMAEDDVPILQHQALMGQSDPKSTAIYAHLATRKLRRVVDQSNPLGKMRAPLLDSLRSIHRATARAAPTPSGPPAVRKPKRGERDAPG